MVTKRFKIIVVGSGLPSLNFIDSFLKKNKKIDVISPDFEQELNKPNNLNNHLFKIFPTPEIKKKIIKVKNYFTSNNLQVDENCKILGSLEFGGLSNYWGLQIDHNIFPDLKCLSKKNKKKLEKSFFEIAQKAKFLGKFNLNKKYYQNDFKIDNSFSNLLTKRKINDFEITIPILAISGKQKNVKKKINLNSIKESTNKINAQNYYKKFLKNKNINFHNYVVEKIFVDHYIYENIQS